MEVYNPNLKANTYRSTLLQSGSGAIDRYIYDQRGEGLGSFFGNLLKSAIPLFGSAIKGAARVAAPHAKRAAQEIFTAGSKRAINHISGDITKKIIQPKSKSRKKRRRI